MAPSSALIRSNDGVLSIRGSITPVSLVLPADMPFEEWEEVGIKLGNVLHSFMWLVCDWALHGEQNYGERFAQVVGVTGLAPGTLKNAMRVADRIPPERRHAGVPFWLHSEVASLEPEEQVRWLSVAASEEWTKEQLRDAIGEATGRTPSVPTCRRCHTACAQCRTDREDAAISLKGADE